MVFGVWCLVFGVWCLVFGVWRLVTRRADACVAMLDAGANLIGIKHATVDLGEDGPSTLEEHFFHILACLRRRLKKNQICNRQSLSSIPLVNPSRQSLSSIPLVNPLLYRALQSVCVCVRVCSPFSWLKREASKKVTSLSSARSILLPTSMIVMSELASERASLSQLATWL